MLRILTLSCCLLMCLAYDPHLNIADKSALPHHIRHGYDYPQINMRDMMQRQGPARRPQAIQRDIPQSSNFQRVIPQSSNFQRDIPQSSNFQRDSGRSQPARQTRFFNMYTPNRFERRSDNRS